MRRSHQDEGWEQDVVTKLILSTGMCHSDLLMGITRGRSISGLGLEVGLGKLVQASSGFGKSVLATSLLVVLIEGFVD